MHRLLRIRRDLDCVALDRRHAWDDGAAREDGEVEVIGEWLSSCAARVNARLPQPSQFGFGRRLGIVGMD